MVMRNRSTKLEFPFLKGRILSRNRNNPNQPAVRGDGDFSLSRNGLEDAWNRNWQAVGMLAAIDLRDGKKAEAVKRLEACHKYGKKDAVMWGLYAYACSQAGDLDKALAVSNDGLGVLPDSKALKDLKSALANKKIKRFKWAKVFGQPWLQFFPEHASQKQMMGGQAGRGQRGFVPH